MPKALKKQPEMKLRRIQPDRKAKRNEMNKTTVLTKSRKFDMVSVFFLNYNMDHISQKIFSYLDFSSLQQTRLVCKIWCDFLNDQNSTKIWLNLLMETKPYLEILLKKFWEYDEENRGIIPADYQDFINKYFEFLENQKKLNYIQMFKLFGKILSIILAFGNGNKDSSGEKILDFDLYIDLKYHLTGEKLYQEIRMKIDTNQFPQWLQMHFDDIDQKRGEIQSLKFDISVIDADYRLFNHMREFLAILKRSKLLEIEGHQLNIEKDLYAILLQLKKQLLEKKLYID